MTSNLDELEAEVARLRANVVTDKSKAIYLYSNAEFIEWLFYNKQELLTTEFISLPLLIKVTTPIVFGSKSRTD